MSNGVLLLFCIIIFSIAVLTLFFIEPHQKKTFDKQKVVKYNDNDYWGNIMNWKDLLNKHDWQRFLVKTYNTTTDADVKETIEEVGEVEKNAMAELERLKKQNDSI